MVGAGALLGVGHGDVEALAQLLGIAVDKIFLNAALYLADVSSSDGCCRPGQLSIRRASSISTVRASGVSYRSTTVEGRCRASVPRATSGRVSSGDVVVSVKRAVSVFSPPFARWPRSYSSSKAAFFDGAGWARPIVAPAIAAAANHDDINARRACVAPRLR